MVTEWGRLINTKCAQLNNAPQHIDMVYKL